MPGGGSGPGKPKVPTSQQVLVLRHYVLCGRNAARTERVHGHSERNVRRLAGQFAEIVDRFDIELEEERRQDQREAQDRARAEQLAHDAWVAEQQGKVREIVEGWLSSEDPTTQARAIRFISETRTKVVALPPEPDVATRQEIRRLRDDDA